MKSTVKISEGLIPKGTPPQLRTGELTRLIRPDGSAPVKSINVGVSLLVMNPGDEVAPHYHNQKEEVYFILSGEGIATHREEGKEEKIKYEKDLCIHITPKVIHDIKVTGNEPLRILVYVSPPGPDNQCA